MNSKMIPIVLQLQKDAIDKNIPVANLLRTAKVIATKLDQNEALTWIDKELNGYMECSSEELPRYRKLTGEPKAYNPYHGWQPIIFKGAKDLKLASKAPLGQALGSIEESLSNGKDGYFVFPYSPERKTNLIQAISYDTDVHLRLDFSQLWGVVDAVRNLVLNWSLELEKAGIVGSQMIFTVEEKVSAKAVTHQFFIQNVGVLGNVSDKAVVTNQQTASLNIDISKIENLLGQIDNIFSVLPNNTKQELAPLIEDLKGEIKKENKNPTKIKKLLQATYGICERVAGNLATQGIMSLIKDII
jgi:hypothetical protein